MTWFLYAGQESRGFTETELDFVLAWVVENDLILLLEIELDLIQM